MSFSKLKHTSSHNENIPSTHSQPIIRTTKKPLVNLNRNYNTTPNRQLNPNNLKQQHVRQTRQQPQLPKQSLPPARQDPAKRTKPPVSLPVPDRVVPQKQTQPTLSSTVSTRRQSNIGSAFTSGTARFTSAKLESGSIRKSFTPATTSFKQNKSVAVTHSNNAVNRHAPSHGHVAIKGQRDSEKIPSAPKVPVANRLHKQIPATAPSKAQTIQRPASSKRPSKAQPKLIIPAVALFDSPSMDQAMEGVATSDCDHQTVLPDMDLDIIPGQDDHSQDPTLVSEYQASIFAYKRDLEIKLMPDPDYMSRQSNLTWHYRVKLIEWLFLVHDEYNLLQETIHLCVNYLDRFLSKVVIPIDQLQLAGVVALLLAYKFEETRAMEARTPEAKALSVRILAHIAGDFYSESRIRQAEIGMLRALDYDLGAPGPMSFLRRISRADNYDDDIRTLAKYLVDVTLCDHRFIRLPSSMIAAVSYRASMYLLFRGDWTFEHEDFSGYKEAMLMAGIKVLMTMLEQPSVSHQVLSEEYKRHVKASMYVQQHGLPALRSQHWKNP
ncbi:hypothetical protein BGZ49_002250 [Haplosporangium sp. Z 27]|nr:hypothetical protein BGZ49_002250 [Haplosporangium sp. Z 27]